MPQAENLPVRRKLKKFGVRLACRILPPLYQAYMAFIERTSAVERSDVDRVFKERDGGQNIAVAILHQDVVCVAYCFRNEDILTLASESDAGDIISSVLIKNGFEVARGGSSSRASRRTSPMNDLVSSGAPTDRARITALTVDGSKGPWGKVKPGVLRLAMKTDADVYCVKVHASRALYMNTWDRTMLPLPFGKISLRASGPISTRKLMGPTEFEATLKHIETELQALHVRSFEATDQEPVPPATATV